MEDKRGRLDRLVDAYVHERAIDRDTFERHRDQLQEQLTIAEMELGAATEEQINVEGVLSFAEHVLTNASRLWMELGLNEKQQLQRVLFPEGLRFDGREFGTAPTCIVFKKFVAVGTADDGMASPPGTGLSFVAA